MNCLPRVVSCLARRPIGSPILLNASRISVLSRQQIQRPFHDTKALSRAPRSPKVAAAYPKKPLPKLAQSNIPPPPPPGSPPPSSTGQDHGNPFPEYTKAQVVEEINEVYQELIEEKTSAASLVVIAVIGLCTALSLVLISLEGASEQGSLWASDIRDKILRIFIRHDTDAAEGRWYTIFTSAFMHGSLLHLGCNMLILWQFGRTMSVVFGPARFLACYGSSIVAGALAQDYFWKITPIPADQTRGGAGASGGALGVFTFMTLFMPSNKLALFFIPMQAKTALSFVVITSIMSATQGWFPGIGHADHLGGIAVAAVFFYLTRGKLSKTLMNKVVERRYMKEKLILASKAGRDIRNIR